MSDTAKYDYDEGFQTKIAACVLKDPKFNKRTLGLIKPQYFEKDTEAAIVSVVTRYYEKYDTVPDIKTLWNLIKGDIDAKIIRDDMKDSIKESLKELHIEDIRDAEYVGDIVAEFARHRAMEEAALKYVELLEKKDYERAAKVIVDASNVGVNEADEGYDFFGEKEVEERVRIKDERKAGSSGAKKSVISTGFKKFDNRLFHKGWAKGEFYVMMGPPKSGKSISLAHFARVACMQGFNVLFVTLEVSKEITAERIEAGITEIAMKELENRSIEAKEKVLKAKETFGRLFIEEFPTGTLTPNTLSRVVQKYKGKAILFDMIVVDYADIMAPNYRSSDPIENSKSIYVDLRAMAQVEDVVMLSAMQTNRDGAKALTAKMEHAAEDFNKIRIPDLVISINASDDERSKGEARLFFAASRNQEGEFTIHIRQRLETMTFISGLVGSH